MNVTLIDHKGDDDDGWINSLSFLLLDSVFAIQPILPLTIFTG